MTGWGRVVAQTAIALLVGAGVASAQRQSILDELAALPEADAIALLAQLEDGQCQALTYDWTTYARPEQLTPPGDWFTWLYLAGRGAGKTRTGAEWLLEQKRNGARRLALIAATASDARDVMVEGESGILACSPPWDTPRYEPSKRRLTWSDGTLAHLYSAEEPQRLRGPQHHAIWADEQAAWKYQETLDQALFGLRLGDNPRLMVTTTPKPTKWIRDMLVDKRCHVTRGTTLDNMANLPAVWVEQLLERYEGTRLGRQEIYAELLEEIEGAIVSAAMIDDARVVYDDKGRRRVVQRPADLGRQGPELEAFLLEWKPGEPAPSQAHAALLEGVRLVTIARVVVAIDPPGSSTSTSAEAGIVAVGLGDDDGLYLLDDASCRASPQQWASTGLALAAQHGADCIVGETNYGGEMVEATLRGIDPDVRFVAVTASRGKHIRFEPLGNRYEQRRVHHVGTFAELERQVCGFTRHGYEGGESPDRADAMVWACKELTDGMASWGIL